LEAAGLGLLLQHLERDQIPFLAQLLQPVGEEVQLTLYLTQEQVGLEDLVVAVQVTVRLALLALEVLVIHLTLLRAKETMVVALQQGPRRRQVMGLVVVVVLQQLVVMVVQLTQVMEEMGRYLQ
jgi:hypothetical protein